MGPRPSELLTEYVDLTGTTVTAARLEVVEDGRAVESVELARLSVTRTGGAIAGGIDLEAPRLVAEVAEARVETFELSDDGVRIEGLAGRTAGGQFTASLAMELSAGGRLALSGRAVGKGIDLSRLTLPLSGLDHLCKLPSNRKAAPVETTDH